jgi:hypothetical protein
LLDQFSHRATRHAPERRARKTRQKDAPERYKCQENLTPVGLARALWAESLQFPSHIPIFMAAIAEKYEQIC